MDILFDAVTSRLKFQRRFGLVLWPKNGLYPTLVDTKTGKRYKFSDVDEIGMENIYRDPEESDVNRYHWEIKKWLTTSIHIFIRT